MDLIIGAGVSGISYAGFTKNDYVIIEKEAEVGGYCRTIKRNNFIWDYSGHFFHFQDPSIKEYVCKSLTKDVKHGIKKFTQIFYNNNYIDFPFQKNIHQLSKEELIDCLYDLFSADEKDNYSSFKEMVYSKYGRSIAEKFLVPYNEKLYACDLNSLDVNAMGRFFPKASKKEIILNFKNKDNLSYNSTYSYPLGGAIEYIKSLMDYVNADNVFLNEQLVSVDIKNKIAKTTKRDIEFDNLISTIPFPQLLKACGEEYSSEDFSSNKVLVLNLGFSDKGDDTVNNWIYIPSKDYIFYRVGYYDNILKTDRMSLYVEIGFPEDQELKSDEYYLEKVLQDLIKMNIVTFQKLIDHEIVLMNPAYVHVTEKSKEMLDFYKKKLAKDNIYSIGRYGSWRYCSIEDNILEARELAGDIKY